MESSIAWVELEAPGAPFGGVHRGLQGVATGVFGHIPTSSAAFIVTPKTLSMREIASWCRGTIGGKGKAHGIPFQVDFIHVCTFRGGQGVRFEQYTNTSAFAAALMEEGASL